MDKIGFLVVLVLVTAIGIVEVKTNFPFIRSKNAPKGIVSTWWFIHIVAVLVLFKGYYEVIAYLYLHRG